MTARTASSYSLPFWMNVTAVALVFYYDAYHRNNSGHFIICGIGVLAIVIRNLSAWLGYQGIWGFRWISKNNKFDPEDMPKNIGMSALPILFLLAGVSCDQFFPASRLAIFLALGVVVILCAAIEFAVARKLSLN